MRSKQVRRGLSKTRSPWILACSHVSILRDNHFILLNQLSRLNKSHKSMAPKLGKSEIDPNTRFGTFFPNFLILQQQKTSSERNDSVILFSLWYRMMPFREDQIIYFLPMILFSPDSAFYLEDNTRVNMIKYISIL